MKYCFLLSLIISVGSLIEDDLLLNEFSKFKEFYKKTYSSQEEEEKRFKYFRKNLEKYEVIHEFSDVPDKEQVEEEFLQDGKFPTRISFIDNLGSPKYQGNCGFCYAFSFVSQIEAQFSIRYGKEYRFSEQELLDCSNGIIGCKGGNPHMMKQFFLGKISTGKKKKYEGRNYLALEEMYPQYDGKSDSNRCKEIMDDDFKYKNTVKFKIDEFGLQLPFINGINCMKSLLIKYGPIGGGIQSQVFWDYKGDIITDNPSYCRKFFVTEDHAITIVGYDWIKDPSTEKVINYWIVRNSWGPTWPGKYGDGYAKIEMGKNICGIENDVNYFKISWDSWCGEGCDNCNYYNNKLECSSCIEGYVFISNLKICEKCPNGCKSCSPSVQKTCYYCFDGYYMYDDTCYQCIKDCKRCTGPTKKDCFEWNFNEERGTLENFIDEEFQNNCFCHEKYLSLILSLSFLLLFLLF